MLGPGARGYSPGPTSMITFPLRRLFRRGEIMTHFIIVATMGLSLSAGSGFAEAPPIFQPGAPGTETRILTPEESLSQADTGYSADDVRFMQHMIVHHGQAVAMGELVEGRTDNPQVVLIAQRIALSQGSEIEMMRAWLYRREQSLEMQHDGPEHGAMMPGHGGHAMGHEGHAAAPSETPLMAGMLSPAQMVELADARDAGFDRLYLVGMIHHHQGAIDMVETLLAEPGNGEDTQLSEFLSAIIADQSAEISRMRGMLAGL